MSEVGTEYLRKFKLFKDLQDTELKEIAPYIRIERYRKRDLIFAEGDPSNNFYMVTSGRVKITKVSQDGKELILEVIPEGEVFGAVAVLRGMPYPANAVAMEDTEVIRVSRAAFFRILDRFPQLMYLLALSLGERMQGAHESLKNIALERVEARIASLLLKLAQKVGRPSDEGIVIEMRLTKQDIAEMVGTTVETSIRTMSKFKKRGLIEETSGRIVIKLPHQLEELVQ